MIFFQIFFPQINDSVIVGRLDDGQDYKWIVPVDYITNLAEYKDSFVMNKTSSKSLVYSEIRAFVLDLTSKCFKICHIDTKVGHLSIRGKILVALNFISSIIKPLYLKTLFYFIASIKKQFFPPFFSAFEVEFPADVNWIKANLNNTGFYRVNYPKHMWDGLILQLTREHTIFSTADRAQMINDAFSLSM